MSTGPSHRLTEQHLWGHMAQHVVLVAVSAPLFVLGAAGPAQLWDRPADWRWRRLRRSMAGPRWPAWAGSALALHGAALWGWHVPGAYDLAVRRPAVHVAEHAMFLGTAVLFWSTVAVAGRRANYGLGVVAVFLMALQGTALGAWMALAHSAWYPVYAAGGHRPGALADQQLAGVVMWCPGGFAYLVAALALFQAWLRDAERRAPSNPVTVVAS